MPDTTTSGLTRAEAAALLRCSVDTVSRRIADGTLRAEKAGRRVVVRTEDVDAVLDARRKRAAALAARVREART